MNKPPNIRRQRTLVFGATFIAVAFLASNAVAASVSLGEVTVPTESGRTLILRLWVPDNTTGAKVRGILVAAHPSGVEFDSFQQDYRPLAQNPQDSYWVETTTTDFAATRRMDLAMQLVAKRHNFAVVGLYFSGQHPGGYAANGPTPADVSMMPAQAAALEAGINLLATTYSRSELATAPIATYGFSGGSGFSLYYAAYRPGRCIAVAHNKGGSIGDYDPVFLEAAEQVPVMLSYGEVDSSQMRIDAIKNVFAYHRAKGALWNLIPDYGLGHESQGYGRFLGAAFFDHLIEKRLPHDWVPGSAPTLRPITEDGGWLGDNTTWESASSSIVSFASSGATLAAKRTMSWLPDQTMAEAWRAVTTHYPAGNLTSPVSSLTTTKPKQLAYFNLNVTPVVNSQTLGLSVPGSNVSSVDWKDGDVVAGTVTTSPFTQTLSNLSAGIHLVRGQLLLNGGGSSTSELAILLVNPSATNQTPTILSGPTISAGTTYAGLPIGCSARASDPDGSIEELLTYTWSATGPGTVTFGPGNGTNAGKDMTATFPVAGSYTLKVAVKDSIGSSTPVNSTLAVTVIAQPPGTLAFSSPTYSQLEGDVGSTTATINVTRTVGFNGAVSVGYATANGTALAGSDYTATSGTLSWANGEATSKSFTVSITGDTSFEPDETIALSLTSPTGGAILGSPSSATLTITNGDPPQPYDSWAIDNHLSGDNALATANPAGDGICNLMKYALGLDPNKASTKPTDGVNPGLPLFEFEPGSLSLTYQKDAGKTDIIYTVKASTDLAGWNTTGIVETTQPFSGNIQNVTAKILIGSDKQKFMRLTIEK